MRRWWCHKMLLFFPLKHDNLIGDKQHQERAMKHFQSLSCWSSSDYFCKGTQSYQSRDNDFTLTEDWQWWCLCVAIRQFHAPCMIECSVGFLLEPLYSEINRKQHHSMYQHLSGPSHANNGILKTISCESLRLYFIFQQNQCSYIPAGGNKY